MKAFLNEKVRAACGTVYRMQRMIEGHARVVVSIIPPGSTRAQAASEIRRGRSKLRGLIRMDAELSRH